MKSYDCVIIGGGIAGLTAAIYTARANLKTLVIEASQFGGQIINSLEIDNYPGVGKSISGYDLIEKILNQVKSFDVEFLEDEVISLSENEVVTKNNKILFKTAIIASGLKRKTLGIEDAYIGAGASYCATCDGAFFKNRDVAVVGGGNTALEDALYLSNIANKVYLIHRRDNFRADVSTINKVKEKKNIEIILNNEVSELHGEKMLEYITLADGSVINVSGLFIAIGLIPETKFLNDLVLVSEQGFVVSHDTKTNVPNIFVAGDVRTKDVRQLITASSDGVLAAINCINYLNS